MLAKHELNVHTAKIMTLGERAEDVFLISGAELGSAKGQLAIESDLLEALAPPLQSSASAISGKQNIGVAEAREVAHAHRIQDAVEVVAFVLHDARMEAVGVALDRPALQIDAAVAELRVARHDAAQARAPTGTLPSPLPSRLPTARAPD